NSRYRTVIPLMDDPFRPAVPNPGSTSGFLRVYIAEEKITIFLVPCRIQAVSVLKVGGIFVHKGAGGGFSGESRFAPEAPWHRPPCRPRSRPREKLVSAGEIGVSSFSGRNWCQFIFVYPASLCAGPPDTTFFI